ncbi:uncharacterized protein LOC117603488 [Osmia lignaria lignaria]|uniref:uncharacterized protein LOC117603488 n=1 Tax=Osmia lignaria lignaria TaxID=1437193 RepID=UPI00402BC1DF
MQKFNTITVLELPDCKINAFGIVLIAEMLMTIGCVQDLNLDMNPNPQENFHLLCAPGGNLWYLSLNLCKISDDGVKRIMNELKYQDAPNEPKLSILNLANNHITKDGALHIGSMLRTNRSLKCLVLLGNRICDEGASMILQELKITALTHEEIMDNRRRNFAELTLLDQLMEKEKDEETDKSIYEEQSRKSSKSRIRHSLTRRSKKLHPGSLVKIGDDESLYQASEPTRRKEIIYGSNKCHPFQNESFPINGNIFATGNLELQYLDLSYNYLSKTTLPEFIECLYYQNYMLGKDKTKGLLHVLLEGKGIERENNPDWVTFQELLQLRQEGKSFTEDTFREFVPEEAEILRKNIKH